MSPRPPSLHSTLSPLFLVATALMASASAQCATQWLPGDGFPGVRNTAPGSNGFVVASTMWDPDGPGPMPLVVVVAGDFDVAGTAVAGRIATYDPGSGVWSALGAGMNNTVTVLATLPNGDLVAGGLFTMAGGVPANFIARWNGTSWSAIGTGMTGMSGNVGTLTTMPNGDLVAGGSFTTAGGVSANNIARWDGTSWSAMGTGTNNRVSALRTLPNGDLVAGGYFTTVDGVSANYIARWDGTSWSALGTGMSSPNGAAVLGLTTLPNGDLVAGGVFTTAGGVPANNIASWNGTSWSALGTGTTGLPNQVQVYRLITLPNGDLVAGGRFLTAGGVSAINIARWNGTGWSALGTGTNSIVTALTTLPNGDLVVGGHFATAGGVPVNRLARWDGTGWSALGTGMNNTVFALTTLPNGDLVAAGTFTRAGSVSANYIARWNGTSWSALGTGMNSYVTALTALPNGDVVAGGTFSTAGGVSTSYIARWDGTGWSALGAGMNSYVNALTTLPNGDVVACGRFTSAGGVPANNIARWNGTSWSALGSGMVGPFSPFGGSLSILNGLTTLPNGDIVAGGFFTTAGGVSADNIARWNGTSWSALGTGTVGAVYTMTTLPNGDLVAGGPFTSAGGVPANNIARWDGTSWSALGTGMNNSVSALTALPNGDLIAGGYFTTAGGVSANRIARWNGTNWSALGTGMDALPFGSSSSSVEALATLPNGDRVAGGNFSTADGLVSAYLAHLTTTCPAIATPFGVGCPSSGGNNTLVANTPPWVDATFRATAIGLPATAIVLEMTSFTPVPQGLAPLTIVFPQAGPGCDILTLPDILIPVVTTTGTVQSSLFLPNTPPLVGLTFYHQMVPIEVDPQGVWVAVTATNALQLTAGAF